MWGAQKTIRKMREFEIAVGGARHKKTPSQPNRLWEGVNVPCSKGLRNRHGGAEAPILGRPVPDNWFKAGIWNVTLLQ
jgi:hypothetical protein